MCLRDPASNFAGVNVDSGRFMRHSKEVDGE
jgi:hypothetical protein